MKVFTIGNFSRLSNKQFVARDFTASHLIIHAQNNENDIGELMEIKIRVTLLTEPPIDIIDSTIYDLLFATDLFGGFAGILSAGTPTELKIVYPFPFDLTQAQMKLEIAEFPDPIDGEIYLINNYDHPPVTLMKTYKTSSPLNVKGARRIFARSYGNLTTVRIQNIDGENRTIPLRLGRALLALDSDIEQNLDIATIHNSAVPMDVTVTADGPITYVTIQ